MTAAPGEGRANGAVAGTFVPLPRALVPDGGN
jgi:hypothetical protein